MNRFMVSRRGTGVPVGEARAKAPLCCFFSRKERWSWARVAPLAVVVLSACLHFVVRHGGADDFAPRGGWRTDPGRHGRRAIT